MKNSNINTLRQTISATSKSLVKLDPNGECILVLSLSKSDFAKGVFGESQRTTDKYEVFRKGNSFIYDFQKLNSDFKSAELSYYAKELVESYGKAKVVLRVSEQDFSDRAEKFFEFLDFFGLALNSAKPIDFVLVISNATVDNSGDFANFLRSFSSNSLNNHQNLLLQTIISKAQSGSVVFSKQQDSISHTQSALGEKLDSCGYIDNINLMASSTEKTKMVSLAENLSIDVTSTLSDFSKSIHKDSSQKAKITNLMKSLESLKDMAGLSKFCSQNNISSIGDYLEDLKFAEQFGCFKFDCNKYTQPLISDLRVALDSIKTHEQEAAQQHGQQIINADESTALLNNYQSSKSEKNSTNKSRDVGCCGDKCIVFPVKIIYDNPAINSEQFKVLSQILGADLALDLMNSC